MSLAQVQNTACLPWSLFWQEELNHPKQLCFQLGRDPTGASTSCLEIAVAGGCWMLLLGHSWRGKGICAAQWGNCQSRDILGGFLAGRSPRGQAGCEWCPTMERVTLTVLCKGVITLDLGHFQNARRERCIWSILGICCRMIWVVVLRKRDLLPRWAAMLSLIPLLLLC